MKLSQYIQKQADKLANSSSELVAISLLKQAGVSEDVARLELAQQAFEKSAASSMQSRGVDYDEALKLVKTAGVKVQDLPGFTVQPSPVEAQVDLLQKTAQDVAALEDAYDALLEKVAELEQAQEAAPEIAVRHELREKIAGTSAFTQADLDAMMSLPSDTLTKIAHSSDQPWRMGSPAGTDTSQMDPLTQFILG